MTERIGATLIDPYLGTRLLDQQSGGRRAPGKPAFNQNLSSTSLPARIPGNTLIGQNTAGQTRITSDQVENLDGGFRRNQTFTQADGREFSRTEIFTSTERGFQRTVAQQNPSGSTTFYEEIYDRQEDGTFRQTLRFTDETGKSNTQIETGVIPDSSLFTAALSGQFQPPSSPFSPSRGTQLDIQA